MTVSHLKLININKVHPPPPPKKSTNGMHHNVVCLMFLHHMLWICEHRLYSPANDDNFLQVKA